MNPRLKLLTFVLFLAFAFTLVGMFVTTTAKAPAKGPYQSALASVGVATAEAAGCANRACEFASPGYVCSEGFGTRCRLQNGCTTVACGGH